MIVKRTIHVHLNLHVSVNGKRREKERRLEEPLLVSIVHIIFTVGALKCPIYQIFLYFHCAKHRRRRWRCLQSAVRQSWGGAGGGEARPRHPAWSSQSYRHFQAYRVITIQGDWTTWAGRRSTSRGYPTRGTDKWPSPSGNLVWWRKLTSWVFCATVRSPSSSSTPTTR